MGTKRRQHNEQYKFRVAMEAAKGNKTLSELASETGVHPSQISAWKRQLMEGGGELLSRKGEQKKATEAGQEAELYEQIGRLQMEVEWLKKKATPFH
jgi:transposase-like protein